MGGRGLAPAVYLPSPASDHSALLPLASGTVMRANPLLLPAPQAIPLAVPPQPLLTVQLRGPLFRDALLDALVGLLFLYYFPVEVRQKLYACLASSHTAWHPGQSPLPSGRPLRVGPCLHLSLSLSRAQQDL